MASFYATQYLINGFHIEPSIQAYLLSAIIFLLFNLLVAPIIKLLLLPINLLTLGIFRWLTQVIVIYLFDLFYVGVTISSYYFGGFRTGLFELPATQLSFFWVLVASALVMSITYNLILALFNGE